MQRIRPSGCEHASPSTTATVLAARRRRPDASRRRADQRPDRHERLGQVHAVQGADGHGQARRRAGAASTASTPAEARKTGLVGYVPQTEDVDWTFPLSVRDVVMMGRYGQPRPHPPRPPRPTARRSTQALERVGLTDLADRQIGELSGGQRKRAFVARGIAQDAGLLLLDEPFAGVDKGSEATIIALLRELRRRRHDHPDLHPRPGRAARICATRRCCCSSRCCSTDRPRRCCTRQPRPRLRLALADARRSPPMDFARTGCSNRCSTGS